MRISDWSSDVCSSDLGVNQVRARLQLSQLQARRDLRDAVKTWDADPRKAALAELHKCSDVRARLAAAAEKTPAERWAPLARELAPRRPEPGEWPATAAMLQQAHETGHDVGAARSAEHTSELQSLMRTSYAVLYLKHKKSLIS